MTGQSITSRRARELQHYNPEKGLRKIAAAEAGEQHCRRARDTEGLIREVVKKMEAQAEYILWRDAVTVAAKKAGHGPGRGKKEMALAQCPFLWLSRRAIPALTLQRAGAKVSARR